MNCIFKNNPHLNKDEQLVAEYQSSGDLLALGKLYQNYMSLVYGVCLKYLKDEELSKDAVMGIFEQLVTKLQEHEVKNFKSWLYVLSRNHCLMELRRKQKHITVNMEYGIMEYESFLHHEDEQVKEKKLSAMEKCMDTLSKEQRLSVDLFYLQQKCYAQVAQQTGFELKQVKSYIQNGKRNLKICIEKQSG